MTVEGRAFRLGRTVAVLASLVIGTAAVGTSPAAQAYLGPSALMPSRDGRFLYVAHADGRQVAMVDAQRGKVLRAVEVPSPPTGLALSADGARLYVTCAAARSTVVVIEPEAAAPVARWTAGHTAMGPAVSPDGTRLYVCNRFDHDVSVFDLHAQREIARIPVDREPIDAAVTPDGATVVVANHLPAGTANQSFITPVVTFIDATTLATSTAALPDGATGIRDLCLSPDGRYAFVTHILASYQLVPSQVVGGWTNINALSVLDTAEKARIDTLQLDQQHRGAGNPWGVAVSPDARWLCVVHSGSHELSLIDANALMEKLRNGPGVRALGGGIPHRHGELALLQRRIPLEVEGPRAVAVIGSTAYAGGYFCDRLEAIDLESEGNARRAIALGPKPRLTARRRGEMLFHDARICYQQWQSCASCHPDGRADALNWDLLNDGVANPKNTKSMLLAHATPPAMSLGVRSTAEEAVRSGLEHILFAGRLEPEAEAIDEYLRSLDPVPSPYLVGGKLSPAARRGRKLFESDAIGCVTCHPGPRYTDQLKHDVGTRGPYDLQDRFDTPTLVEVWRTAPYLHDGRYATLVELFAEGNHGMSRGAVESLSAEDIQDLAEFVLSL